MLMLCYEIAQSMKQQMVIIKFPLQFLEKWFVGLIKGIFNYIYCHLSWFLLTLDNHFQNRIYALYTSIHVATLWSCSPYFICRLF
jgi:hypothetical protein